VASAAEAASGAAALHDDGYRFVIGLKSTADDFDQQGHLNNVAAVHYFQDVRIGYVMTRLAPRWTDHLREHGLVRQGKAGIMEERIVEAATGRAVARAWIVQLLVQAGRVVEYPAWYWEVIAEAEGAPVHVIDAGARAPWGPPV
jgi:acyl-CoA thioesterase FadM